MCSKIYRYADLYFAKRGVNMNALLASLLSPPIGGIVGWTARMFKATPKLGWKVEVVDEKQIGNRKHGDVNNYEI